MNQRQCQKHLTWDKEKRAGFRFNGPKSSLDESDFHFISLFYVKVIQSGESAEGQNLKCLKSSV